MKENIPGNYPSNLFLDKKVENKVEVDYEKISLSRTGKTVVLLDIHNFSKYCEEKRKTNEEGKIEELLKEFFTHYSKEIKKEDGLILKFIGDAILCAFHKDEDKVKKICSKMLRAYKKLFKVKYNNTDLAIIIMQSVELMEGYIGSDNYLDWSIFGVGINFMFKAVKENNTEGRWTIIKSNGELMEQSKDSLCAPA